MSDAEAPTPRRGRRPGRPATGSRAQRASARDDILKAASKEFAERGYDSASLRAIARRAGVDPALVHHYFADKAELFAETIAAPIRPDRLLEMVLRGPREATGTSIVRYVLEQLGAPQARTRVVALLRAALGTGPATRVFKEFLVREVFLKLARAAGGDDAELRADLAASQVVGLMVIRFVLRVEPLASAPVEDLVQRVGPVIQWHLTGYGLPQPAEQLTPAAVDDQRHPEHNSSRDE
jgi:AcrR family transcriptional regulator